MSIRAHRLKFSLKNVYYAQIDNYAGYYENVRRGGWGGGLI